MIEILKNILLPQAFLVLLVAFIVLASSSRIEISLFELLFKRQFILFHFDQKSYLSTSGRKILRFDLYAVSMLRHVGLLDVLVPAG
ncbi:hypothetical protein ELD05_00375 [Caldicellulosiruptor changbaiensis]|uniref:Uncharacterized protein n=1 Tax=Caldicellulosiruptor changbaiensis TaxID=1222016 RepID=A0A3T0D2K6_9FIRM|nr:hypothetical protein [Caldicellulosiruptor changbaiensis]AZT89259.1 hypothetical protein ELD05_00375 [Caldicellulosiruptor changbaiensis]